MAGQPREPCVSRSIELIVLTVLAFTKVGSEDRPAATGIQSKKLRNSIPVPVSMSKQ
jgi:hypothetical protein